MNAPMKEKDKDMQIRHGGKGRMYGHAMELVRFSDGRLVWLKRLNIRVILDWRILFVRLLLLTSPLLKYFLYLFGANLRYPLILKVGNQQYRKMRGMIFIFI